MKLSVLVASSVALLASSSAGLSIPFGFGKSGTDGAASPFNFDYQVSRTESSTPAPITDPLPIPAQVPQIDWRKTGKAPSSNRPPVAPAAPSKPGTPVAPAAPSKPGTPVTPAGIPPKPVSPTSPHQDPTALERAEDDPESMPAPPKAPQATMPHKPTTHIPSEAEEGIPEPGNEASEDPAATIEAAKEPGIEGVNPAETPSTPVTGPTSDIGKAAVSKIDQMIIKGVQQFSRVIAKQFFANDERIAKGIESKLVAFEAKIVSEAGARIESTLRAARDANVGSLSIRDARSLSKNIASDIYQVVAAAAGNVFGEANVGDFVKKVASPQGISMAVTAAKSAKDIVDRHKNVLEKVPLGSEVLKNIKNTVSPYSVFKILKSTLKMKTA